MIRIHQWTLLLCIAASARADTSPPKDTRAASLDSAAWVHVGGGSGGLWQLEFHPTRPHSIAASWALGLCATTDGGEHWRIVTDYPNSAGFLGWDPDSAGALLFAEGNEGLLRSSDAGEHWSVQGRGAFGGLRSLALVAGDRVGYACSDKGVFKTNDGGAHWRKVWTPPGNHIVLRVVRNPAASDSLFAIQAYAMWRSTNAGKSWQKVLTTKGTVSRLLWHRRRPALLLAGTDDGALYRSADGGIHWLPTAPPTSGPIVLASNPAADDAFYDGASLRRLFVTYDAGAQWLPAGEPAAAGDSGAAPLRLLEPNPASPGTLYALSREGLLRSADGGVTWSRADVGMSLINVHWIAVNPDRAGMLLVGGIFGGVARSPDGGVSWDPLSFESTPLGVAAGGEPGAFFVAGASGVMRSRDSGDHWESVHHGLLSDMGRYNASALAVGSPPRRALYVQMDSTYRYSHSGIVTRRLFKSTDSGDSWTPIGDRLPNAEIEVLVVDPTSPDRVYAATRSYSSPRVDSLWRTDNGGAKWEPIELRLPEVCIHALVVVPSRPSTVFVLEDSGLFASRDAGLTWQPTGNGLPQPQSIECLAADPARPGRIFAGSRLAVFVSEDDGGHWRRLAPDLPAGWINCLAVDSRAGDLYAGTRHGVFVLRGVAR